MVGHLETFVTVPGTGLYSQLLPFSSWYQKVDKISCDLSAGQLTLGGWHDVFLSRDFLRADAHGLRGMWVRGNGGKASMEKDFPLSHRASSHAVEN